MVASALFEEIDYRPTSIGAVSLRRRRDLRTGEDVFEIKLGEEFLMSSQFIVSEVELARLALAELANDGLEVVVGGLGLGHTARTVLDAAGVSDLIVVDALQPVIDWHEAGLVPLGEGLTADPRCRFVLGDFFAMAAGEEGFDPDSPGRRFDAVIVDIDHSPEALLNQASAGFYGPDGLAQIGKHLKPGGVFALWSNDRPDQGFAERLLDVFGAARAHEVRFFNPLQDNEAIQTVYVARHEKTGR
ncbi:spermidine synthase [Pelagibacterium montanilacus]|uniref:spermidine synthase n=1 Tax=Pelagibacterium montanilacus TaxID=2185280 RepID=UPI000F8CFC81|nr:spermidine synthase [Pelagibacterium montanilacus]